MRQYFTPDKVRKWTDDDLQKLVGKYVIVECPASDWYRENVPDGGDWEGGAGICTEAGFRDGNPVRERERPPKIMFINFDYGMGWHWLPGVDAHISVCDEHGEHRVSENPETLRWEDAGDDGAAECLRTLGVRGKSTIPDAKTRGEEESGEGQETPKT